MGAARTERDWELIKGVLPAGWEKAAIERRAIRRDQGPLAKPEALLRLLLGKAASDKSNRETAAEAGLTGLAEVSDVAIHKRERQSGDWLEWIADGLLGGTMNELPQGPFRLRLVDATTVSVPGSKGTDFRLHVCVNLPDRRFSHAELTNKHGGETLMRFPVMPGDIYVGDRAYGTSKGVGHVVAGSGMPLVRITTSALPLYMADGERIDLLGSARPLEPGQMLDVDAWAKTPQEGAVAGRLCIYALSEEDAQRAARRVRRRASRQKGRPPGARAVEGSRYIFIFTTASRGLMSVAQVFACYRLRWQVELAFKMLKTVLRFGKLPNHRDDTSRTWLLAKLINALILERLARADQRAFPPGRVAA